MCRNMHVQEYAEFLFQEWRNLLPDNIDNEDEFIFDSESESEATADDLKLCIEMQYGPLWKYCDFEEIACELDIPMDRMLADSDM